LKTDNYDEGLVLGMAIRNECVVQRIPSARTPDDNTRSSNPIRGRK
jgi:hypothetical protein